MLFKVEDEELVDQLEKMNKTSLVTLGDFIIKMVNCEIGKEDLYSRIGNTLTENLEIFKIEPRINEDMFNRIENTLTESIEKLKMEPKINESVEKDKKKPLSSSTSVYSGSCNEDLEESIFIVTQNFGLSNINSDEYKLKSLANFVKGMPLKTLRSYLNENLNPKVMDYYKLLERLIPEDARLDSIKNKLLDLSQGDNFYEFLSKFQDLALKLQSKDLTWSEKDTIFAFKRALKPRVKFEFEKIDIKIAEEAYQVASKYEKCLVNSQGKTKTLEVHRIKQIMIR